MWAAKDKPCPRWIPPNGAQKRGVPDDDDYPAGCQSVDLSQAEPGNLFGKSDCHRMNLLSFLDH
jgi:hypothetical protein